MEESYPKLSFKKLAEYTDLHSINFLIFPQSATTTLHDISFNEPFLMDGLFLGLCVKGHARIKVNFQEFELQKNTILVLLPSQIINIIEKSDDYLVESLYVSFDFLVGLPLPKDFDSLFNIRKFPCLQISEPVMRNLLEYYAFIMQRYERKDQIYRETIVRGLLYSMIMEFLTIYKENKTDEVVSYSSRQEEITNQFFRLLFAHFKEERSVGFYADKLCITRKYLSSIVKEVTGQTPLDWIHDIFIIHVKVALKSTTKSIIEISEELNISNPSFFCRLFKEHTGMSPLEYRNRE